MRIIDLLKADAIELNASVSSKAEAIDKMVELHKAVGNLNDADAYKEAILAREEQSSTAIGEGIAVPHAKSDSVKTPGLSSITVPGGVDYDAPDGKPSDILFMIAAPLDGDLHLEILSRLMVMLMDADFCDRLRKAKTPKKYLEIIDAFEAEKYPEEPVVAEAPKEGYQILAVTACPTGIAHTYMAAEALEKAAEKMGVTIKVETAGSGGSKNVLTKEEIAACDGIICAVDRNIEMARFDGKPVYKTAVSNGINKPEELINKILNKEAPVYHSTGEEAAEEAGGDGESFGRKIYKHLMNGVSHMLPFVVGGGVLIALGFLIDTIAGNADVGGTFGFTNPVAAVIFWIGKAAFAFMLPILAGYISMSIADRPGLLPGIVGGYLATTGATLTMPTGNDAAVSGFLGALLAGFVAGIIVNFLKKAFNFMPKAMDGIKPVF
ncbi:MAG: PTS sugar transporter subunit IIA, partial [Clostridia bacterium]|nr:PTS sugar transporter subunit IIA [Clostridia bacterium]